MPMNDIPPDLARSPVFAPGARPHPGLVRAGSSWGMVLALAAALLLGAVTFFSLNNARQGPQLQAAPVAAAPAPVIASPPEPAPMVIQAAPPPSLAQVAPAPDTRAPAMVVDFSQASAPPQPAAAAPAVPAAGGPTPAVPNEEKLSSDEQFAARSGLANGNMARATQLRDLSRTAPQGTVIPAILETAINSDLPGFVRAVISRDVRGFDGSTVLVPRGSKLIGQYRSAVALSQTRAFVVWSRILTPAGVSIEINSPGTDRLGQGGLSGETDTHFFQRFGSAILLSVMSAGLSALTEPSNNTSIIIGSSQQASQVAGIALQRNVDIPVTITVPQGTPLQVFVTRDLDFSGVARP